MKKNNFSNIQGFTLIEMIVVIGIICLLTGFGIAKYNDYNQQSILRNQAKEIADVIELAKKKATSADLNQQVCNNFQGYRVEINTSTFLLKIKCDDSYTIVHTYLMTNSNVTSTTTNNHINFLPMGSTDLGSVDPSYILHLTLKNSRISQCIDISISSIGIVNINEALFGC